MQAPQSDTCSIRATGLACRRGDRILFRDLSLSLGAGQALQVAGPNGIGKSSLIRIIAGLLEPYAGTVERRGATGLVDERTALDPHLPLGAALAFWQRLDRSTACAADALGLTALMDIPVRFLSTGQKKRAAIARLLAQGAPVWLLDEPLNGLDSAAAALVETLIAGHLASGGIALVASHQPLALPAASRLDLAGFAA